MIPVIGIPYHLARRDFEVGLGAARIVEALGGPHERIDLPGGISGDVEVVAEMDRQLAALVRARLEADLRVLVLAGNCSSASGTLGGMPERTGIIWFDAHGDFNTPDTTVSGAIEGMALAVAMGDCHSAIRDAAGLANPIEADRVLLAGTRDLDPGERERVARSGIHVAPSEGWSIGRFREEAERIRAASDAIYLHVDLDAVDPTMSPGVNYQTPGGLTPDELIEAVELIAAWPELRAAAILNYNPNHDPEGKTLQLALRVAAILGRSSAAD